MDLDQTSEDRTLVAAAARGDDRGWRAIVRKYGQLVWSVGRRCGLSAADAEDLVQTVFAILVRRLGQLDDASRLSGWLVVTAKREAWRMAERARKHRGSSLDDGLHPVEDPEPEPEFFERRQAVREAVSRLGPRCRELITDLFGRSEVPSYDEVARRLGMSTNSVGPTRRRCLQDLLEDLRGRASHLFESPS